MNLASAGGPDAIRRRGPIPSQFFVPARRFYRGEPHWRPVALHDKQLRLSLLDGEVYRQHEKPASARCLYGF